MTKIEQARRYVAKYPSAISGQGGDKLTYRLALVLIQRFELPEDDALALLLEYNQRCQPMWSEVELHRKIRSAANTTSGKAQLPLVNRSFSPPRPPKTKLKFDPKVLRRIADNLRNVKDPIAFLAEISPVDVAAQNSATVLRHLYPRGSGEKVLLFNVMKSSGQMLWRANCGDAFQDTDLPAGPDGVWFLPQPVSGKWLPNPRNDGKKSRRSLESVTSWRYVVLESDEADPDDWLRCLIQLPLRIACICESGKRSIHALVRIDAESKADWDERMAAMKPALITLGADRGALTAVRLSRLPQAMRGERLQRLLFLDPQASDGPILTRKPREPSYEGQRDE